MKPRLGSRNEKNDRVWRRMEGHVQGEMTPPWQRQGKEFQRRGWLFRQAKASGFEFRLP